MGFNKKSLILSGVIIVIILAAAAVVFKSPKMVINLTVLMTGERRFL